MKNKKLVILLSILGFLAVIVLLCSTVFTLKTVKINWLTTRYKLTSVTEDKIIKENNFDFGGSIFFLKKDKIISKLEEKYPYIKVVSIETHFPNKISVHVCERESLFAVKIQDGKYAIVDDEFKILEYPVTDAYFTTNLDEQKAIKVSLENISFGNDENLVAGQYLVKEDVTNLLNKFAYCLKESGNDTLTSKNLIKSINLKVSSNETYIDIKTNYMLSIKIEDPEKLLTEKLQMGFKVYDIYHAKDFYANKTILVKYDDEQQKIKAGLIE